MNTSLNKIASILAFGIGVMAVVAGGKVLLGNDPGYYVLDGLPLYNFIAGLISAVFTAVLIWKNSRYALIAALSTLGIHSVVMVLLLTAYRDVVAVDSIRAMTLRISVWSVITVLILVQRRIQAGMRLKGAQTPTVSEQ